MATRSLSSIGTQTEERRMAHPGIGKITEMRHAYEESQLALRKSEKEALQREIAMLHQERDRLRLEILQLQKANEQTKKLRDLLDDSFLPKPAPSPDWFGHRALEDITDGNEAALTDLVELEASCSQIT